MDYLKKYDLSLETMIEIISKYLNSKNVGIKNLPYFESRAELIETQATNENIEQESRIISGEGGL